VGALEPELYLYGVVRSRTRPTPRGPGVSGHRGFGVVEAGAIGGVVSELDARPNGNPEDISAHLDTVQQVMSVTTVLPMRFGIVLASERELRERLLVPYGRTLERLLREMDGMVEMRVHAYYIEEPVLAEIVADRKDLRALREHIASRSTDATYYDRIRLGQAITEALTQQAEVDGASMAERLGQVARGVIQGERAGALMVTVQSFLVAEADLGRFRDTAKGWADTVASRIKVRISGPFPPFSFVEQTFDPAMQGA
jgi:hypothetical protein